MISVEFQEAAKASRPRPCVLLRFASNPTGRFWIGGVGNLALPADDIDLTGGVYAGCSKAVDLPAFEALINGKAQQIDITFSGLSAEIIGLARQQAREVRGLKVNIGLAMFGEDLQLASRVYWLRTFTLDAPRISRSRSGPASFIKSVILSAVSSSIWRRRSRQLLFTNASQQAISPGDRFCERTSLYLQTTTRKWPR